MYLGYLMTGNVVTLSKVVTSTVPSLLEGDSNSAGYGLHNTRQCFGCSVFKSVAARNESLETANESRSLRELDMDLVEEVSQRTRHSILSWSLFEAWEGDSGTVPKI